ncbi:MAG TPA: cytochrome C oxidase subunit IV family protein [Gemmatimonadales bacterium]|nr:cytochrome C oxidase subunit IV family protein [Gemmatimonadales bacterium]
MTEAKRHHPNYMSIFVMLTVLTAVELGVAFISQLSRTMLLIILLVLAVWKALLVALYFMHLRFETNRVRILAIAPLPLAVIMVIAVITEYVW